MVKSLTCAKKAVVGIFLATLLNPVLGILTYLGAVLLEAKHTWKATAIDRVAWPLAYGAATAVLALTGEVALDHSYHIEGSLFYNFNPITIFGFNQFTLETVPRMFLGLGLLAFFFLFVRFSRYDAEATLRILRPVYLFGVPLAFKYVAVRGVLLYKGMSRSDFIVDMLLKAFLFFKSFSGMTMYIASFVLLVYLSQKLPRRT